MPQDKWFTLKRNGLPHHIFLVSKSIVQDLEKLVGIGFSKHLCIFRSGQQVDWHYQVAGADAVARFILEKTYQNKNYHQVIFDQWQEYNNQLERYYREISTIDLTEQSAQKLLVIYNRLIELFVPVSALGTLSDFLSSQIIEKEATNLLEKVGIPKDELSKCLNALMTSSLASPFKQEQIELLEIASAPLADRSDKLKEHAQKYWYIQNDYLKSFYLSPDYFALQLNNIAENPKIELGNMLINEREIKDTKSEISAKASQPPQNELPSFIEMVNIHGNLWDLKKMAMQKTFYYIDQVMAQIAKRKNLSLNELKLCLPSEVNSQNANLSEIADQRKELVILEILTSKVNIFIENDANLIIDELEDKIDGNTSQIKGQIANLGISFGKARIIFDPTAKNVFSQGDILVTGMTTPDFIPLMKKAGAIVTDEGGLTCHAAIVSRELGIPCLIGTKTATKIIKNDDMVNVDATNGVIEILEPILQGIPASGGIIKGKVKIINKERIEQDFAVGDILVTRLTDPSMISLIIKAGAIVTDIGGITSHPAIISREMGIPCVVATTNATRTLKNGQIVIVDGKKGAIYEAK